MSLIDKTFTYSCVFVTPFHLQTKESLLQILRVRNDPRVRKWMENGDPIVEEAHLRFCRNLEDRNDAVYLSVESASELIGVIYLTGIDIQNRVAELGLYRNPGRLLMTILEEIAHKIGIETLRLRVRSNNERAIHLYQMMGYIFSNTDGEYFSMYKEIR